MALTIGYLISGKAVSGHIVSPGPGNIFCNEVFPPDAQGRQEAIARMARGPDGSADRNCSCGNTLASYAVFVFYPPGFLGNMEVAYQWKVMSCRNPCRAIVKPEKQERVMPAKSAADLVKHYNSLSGGDLVFLDGDNDDRLPTVATYVGQTDGNTGVLVKIARRDYQYFWDSHLRSLGRKNLDNFALYPMPEG